MPPRSYCPFSAYAARALRPCSPRHAASTGRAAGFPVASRVCINTPPAPPCPCTSKLPCRADSDSLGTSAAPTCLLCTAWGLLQPDCWTTAGVVLMRVRTSVPAPPLSLPRHSLSSLSVPSHRRRLPLGARHLTCPHTGRLSVIGPPSITAVQRTW
jgi:hypothetical protein